MVAFLKALCARSGPTKLALPDATEALNLFLRVSTSSSHDAVHYATFLRILQECNSRPVTTKSTSTQPVLPPCDLNAASSDFPITNVADYLISHATTEERENFEGLMDALHKFQQSITKRTINATPSSTSADGPMTSSTDSQPDTTKEGDAVSTKQTDATSRRAAGDMQPIENGIVVALGGNLLVRVQFTTTTTLTAT
ncbi:hypothetical protein Poli38472_011682 [Pythium oligandrum]|uniref:Uncharacterized protein n=1 Tax=Pythium oligandrum TaxID=41045 RepID=A0A8K1FEM2_PYTOL|nr:hypothetical protein Poli38472_011682 [Pythium oligandrum]|eukprot:TMW58094.1 hypothetical protein Poli38472_011682 [Pythium oligandrum]